jgi:hypothetical protein
MSLTVTLLTTEHEYQAELVASSLRSSGIAAQAIGGALTGYRAEAPTRARVVVRKEDLLAARLALEEIRASAAQIDWDSIDVGPADAEVEPAGEVQEPPRLRLTEEGQPARDARGKRAKDRVRRRVPARTDGDALRDGFKAREQWRPPSTRAWTIGACLVLLGAMLVPLLITLRVPGRLALLAPIALLLFGGLVALFVRLLGRRGA